jgi:hypothetical protein
MRLRLQVTKPCPFPSSQYTPHLLSLPPSCICAVLFTDKVTSEDTEVAAIAAFTGVADECFAANGGKPLDNLRFAIARESDEAVGPVRKFLGASFLSAKDGPTATTLVIIDVTNGKKYVFDGGVPTAETCRAFVQKFLADTLEGVNVRE